MCAEVREASISISARNAYPDIGEPVFVAAASQQWLQQWLVRRLHAINLTLQSANVQNEDVIQHWNRTPQKMYKSLSQYPCATKTRVQQYQSAIRISCEHDYNIFSCRTELAIVRAQARNLLKSVLKQQSQGCLSMFN